MKKVVNILQWVALAGVAAMVLWLVLRPAPPLAYHPDTWCNWTGFMALSYAGVTRDETDVYPSSETLRDHFLALKQAGYETITTADVAAFLEHRTPLPDNAVLILFEGARKETLIRAYPMLRRFGMQAVLCVPTESLESWDESRLKARDIRKLVKLPHWSIASMGDDAVNPIAVTETGATDHFLSSRRWIAREKRVENDEEFKTRIGQDYATSAAVLGELNGAPVPAYVYPFADNGRRLGADPLAAGLNFNCLTSRYQMAFVSALNPYNPAGRDPYALTRLRINGNWTGAQVVSLLEHAKPRTADVTSVGSEARWMLVGGARVVQECVRLDMDGVAWLKGSDLWTDAEIGADVTLPDGAALNCYARFRDLSDRLRLTIGQQGIRLQEVNAGVPVTLATGNAPTGRTFRVVWRMKGIRCWLAVDGQPVFGPVPLSGLSPSGLIGFESIAGHVTVSGLSVRPIRSTGITGASWATLPDSRRSSVTTYLPEWPAAHFAPPPQLGLDIIQAVSEGVAVWPVVTEAGGSASLTESRVGGLMTELARRDLRPFVKGLVLEAAQSARASMLRTNGIPVMHHVRAGEAMPVEAVDRSDYVWLEGSGSNVEATARLFLHYHPPSHLLVQEDALARRFPGACRVVAAENGGTP